MNDEKIEKANRLMILFDNIRKMDDTEIVVFLHNLGHYLYDRTKGDLYLIEGKEIKRLESSQLRIDKAIHFLNTEYNTYPSSEEWRKDLIKILNGDDNE